MLLTKEGNKLAEIGESQSWVWCVKQRPKQNYVAVGGEDGSITMHQVVFSTVHGLCHEWYAYRDNMTDGHHPAPHHQGEGHDQVPLHVYRSSSSAASPRRRLAASSRAALFVRSAAACSRRSFGRPVQSDS